MQKKFAALMMAAVIILISIIAINTSRKITALQKQVEASTQLAADAMDQVAQIQASLQASLKALLGPPTFDTKLPEGMFLEEEENTQ